LLQGNFLSEGCEGDFWAGGKAGMVGNVVGGREMSHIKINHLSNTRDVHGPLMVPHFVEILKIFFHLRTSCRDISAVSQHLKTALWTAMPSIPTRQQTSNRDQDKCKLDVDLTLREHLPNIFGML
jgi:hypothetical protein